MMIDAHQQYWQPLRGDYHWMPADDPVISRAYGPGDLAPILKRHGIDATVLVQAAPTIEETEYMLGLADATPTVAAVVGWIDFENGDHLHHLRRLARHPKFVGVRPMIQDIPDLNWMLKDEVQWGFRAVMDLGLCFDALGLPVHLPNFHTLLRRYTGMRMVIDHCMKPAIRHHAEGPQVFAAWSDGISRLAEAGAYCKLSGLVTEANSRWSIEDLRPYGAHVLRAFGAERVMWGSDWPACQRRASYDEWRAAAEALAEPLTEAGRAMVFGGTAARFYGLSH